MFLNFQLLLKCIEHKYMYKHNSEYNKNIIICAYELTLHVSVC